MQIAPLQNQSHINALDGVRGIACLLVLQSHLVNTGYIEGAALKQGILGVVIFFILSGFLMGFLYFKVTATYQIIDYLIKRFFRVYPAYFVVSLIAAIVAYTIGLSALPYSSFSQPIFDLDYLVQQLALQKGWGHFWTIPLEMHFYLLFAFFLFLIRPVLFQRLLVLTFVTIILLYTSNLPFLAHRWLMELDKNSYAVIWRFIGIFTAGACFGIIYRVWQKTMYLRYVLNTVANIGTLMLLFLLFASNHDALLDSKLLKLNWHDITWLSPVIGFYIFSCAVASNSRLQLINNIFLRYTGKISYSLYLWHLIIFCILTNSMDLEPVEGLMLSLIFSYVIATASYKFIEIPGINAGTKLILVHNPQHP